MGGLDWAGLPFVCELLGFEDPERLARLLLQIKTYRPPEEDPQD